MKPEPEIHTDNDEMLPEYNFSGGVRGKHYEAYKQSQKPAQNVVTLEPDVAAVFQDSAAVNDALRMLLKIAGSMQTVAASKAQPSKDT